MTASGGNGRITLALIGQKLDYLTQKVDTFCDKAEPRLSELEKQQAVISERVETAEEEISTLRKVSNVWSSINSLAALIAGGIAAVLGQK